MKALNDFDIFLKQIDSRGTYQRLVCLLMCTASAGIALQVNSHVLLDAFQLNNVRLHVRLDNQNLTNNFKEYLW